MYHCPNHNVATAHKETPEGNRGDAGLITVSDNCLVGFKIKRKAKHHFEDVCLSLISSRVPS